jgi:hypothetical protein
MAVARLGLNGLKRISGWRKMVKKHISNKTMRPRIMANKTINKLLLNLDIPSLLLQVASSK